jgi:XTP/dITP diphosphohydrolase
VEIEKILGELGFRFITKDQIESWPEIVESGDTYLENALLKARALAHLTGKPALADDSGIEIDALDGAPGVRSARFAGPAATDEENNRKMAELLDGVPLERRTARYRCVAVVVTPEGEELAAQGTCEGRIAELPRGTGGFGYDPWFIPSGQAQTFGELPAELKHSISHRGKALRALAAKVAEAGMLPGR